MHTLYVEHTNYIHLLDLHTCSYNNIMTTIIMCESIMVHFKLKKRNVILVPMGESGRGWTWLRALEHFSCEKARHHGVRWALGECEDHEETRC